MAVAAALCIVCGACDRASRTTPARTGPARRIVSLVPSATEVVFALGAGDRVVGVSSFCNYPPEARALPRLGGLYDPNYEAIVGLGPDLVLVVPSQEKAKTDLADLGVPCLAVNQADVPGILGSIRTIGAACGLEERAAALVEELAARMRAITRATAQLPRPRVLVCVGRPVGSGALEELYVAGPRSFYDELITRAGGINVVSDTAVEYPVLSKEALVVLDPDVILDMLPDLPERGVSPQHAIAEWDELALLRAVKTRRVHVVTAPDAVIPGPRFIANLERVASLLHPGIEL
jgi:iron complex transport system substrate-binding protein